METNNDLSHFGVKGMHWGVRRAQNIVNSPDGRRAQRLGKEAGGAAKNLREGRTPTKIAFNKKVQTAGGLHKISDEELKNMLNRLENEKKYTKMLTEDADKRAQGRKQALKILGEVGKIAVPIVIGFAAKSASDRGVFRTTAFTSGKPAINVVRKAISA